MPLKNLVSLLLVTLSINVLIAQTAEKNASSNITQDLKKLLSTTSVLYIAAHPDDENTRLISYLANEKLCRTAYLSLTRGDGGQNLIGTEKGPLLGLLRTQELLAARRIDGGEQFFTRAIDFGYSKTAKETFELWNREEILHDVVLVIRKFRPDVIITRFPPNEYAGHGHHTASAILAQEAFKAAADVNRFTNQFKDYNVSPWQVKRLYFNASSWWNEDLPKLAQESDDYISVDIGAYNPTLGLGYGEMAALSRSQHKSQGFGAARQRGSVIEYLQYQQGEKVKNGALFSGIANDWSRYGVKGVEIQKYLMTAIEVYDPEIPKLVLENLEKARELLSTLIESESDGLLLYKKQKIEECMLRIAGIYAEVTMQQPLGVPGEELSYEISVVNRSDATVSLNSIDFFGKSITPKKELVNNELYENKGNIVIPKNLAYSNPYWLNHPAAYTYKVDDPELIGLPEYHQNKADISFSINGTTIKTESILQYRWVDREKGELYQPFFVCPALTSEIMTGVTIFNEGQEGVVNVKVNSHLKDIKGQIRLVAGDNWEIKPTYYDFEFLKDEDEKVYGFIVVPPSQTSATTLQVMALIGKDTLRQQLSKVDYDHIQGQYLLQEAKASAINLNIEKVGNKIAYVMGAGDEIPENLRQIGYEVALLDPKNINSTDLSNYDAVIIGIRAFNTIPELTNTKDHVLDYVETGGKVIVQYQTSRGIDANDFSPYPLQLGRTRVTDENAKVTKLLPNHPVFNTPNRLSDGDFDNWVQERGLYFGENWDERYVAPIGWNDEGEDLAKGGLLIADYGKGAFIYTGISFFRQLPAGVPGAFRLFANIISYKPPVKK